MHYSVVEARYLRDFVIWLKFADGKDGEVDLANELWGPVFEPLKDPSYFRQFKLEYGTIEWPNGADFAPEFLYERAHIAAQAPLPEIDGKASLDRFMQILQ